MPALSWQELLEVLVYETHLESWPGDGYPAQGSRMFSMEGETMSAYICGNCLFAEESGSSDLVYCFIRDELRKVNDYPCAKWKSRKGLEEEVSDA